MSSFILFAQGLESPGGDDRRDSAAGNRAMENARFCAEQPGIKPEEKEKFNRENYPDFGQRGR